MPAKRPAEHALPGDAHIEHALPGDAHIARRPYVGTEALQETEVRSSKTARPMLEY